MHFFIDESGHTGANLFDSNQPVLYYGVLSSESDIDKEAKNEILSLREKFNVQRLHANELGIGRILSQIDEIKEIKNNYKIKFDVHEIHKYDHAIISFFDQVFDSGMNDAVSWNTYWTPMRYLILEDLATIFDIETAKKAWQARIDKNNQSSEATLVEVCKELKERSKNIDHFLIREIIQSALNFTIKNPSKISYNGGEPIEMSPNMVGFQFVLQALHERIKNKQDPVSITVDQQSEFNKSQIKLHELYLQMSSIEMANINTLPSLEIKDIPNSPLKIRPGDQSIGLELVDIFLWIFKRSNSDKGVPAALRELIYIDNQPINNKLSIDQIKNNWPTNNYLRSVTRSLTAKTFNEFSRLFNTKTEATGHCLYQIPLINKSKII
ncbi:DUF3800 domain-containing protein [Comamonas aquatica]|jgi:hypothetical protein|uniref:DUF3800 domain-containing protein n=1 Tax=Comamonas aquatica TaxID=225991 RepID=UPI0024496849|nr:DUF3800 domain-containing protein [Comamonas aquatica]MDH0898329.1 DUF3800 domain-containing protein [Comamonas aquatica]